MTKNPSYPLVALLVVAAFVIGMLFTKIQYLEQSKSPTPTQNGTAPQGAPAAQAPAGKIKEVTDADHVRGNKNAKVSLVVYSDLECPFCQRFHPTTSELLKKYGDQVKLIYRHYPLSFHANAQKEAEASECAAEQGGDTKFWEFVDKIFERTTAGGTGFALDKLGPLAAELGLDQSKFQSCLDSGTYAQRVKDQFADGTTGGVSGTPTNFIVDQKGGTKMLVGAVPAESVSAAIDEALKK